MGSDRKRNGDQEKVAKEAASKALEKIDARKRAEAVNSVDVANAWSSLGMSEIEISKTEVKSVRQESEQSSADLSKVVVKDDVDEQMNVDDLLAAPDVTKVRSDAPEIETGKADAEIQFNTVEPDWELIEKIQSIAKEKHQMSSKTYLKHPIWNYLNMRISQKNLMKIKSMSLKN